MARATSPKTPLATGRQPRYLHLAQTLSAEIAAGVYPKGTAIPTEFDLCDQFGASRYTVRAAIEQLARAGLVIRKPRVGTIVQREHPVDPGFRMNVGGISDLLQYAASTRMRVIGRRLREVEVGDDVALDKHAGEHWLYVEGVRFSKESRSPICFNRLWINPDFRSVTGVTGDVAASVFDLIAKQFNITIERVDQEIFAAALPKDVALQLKLRSGSPGLWVKRSYSDHSKRLVEVAL